MILYKRIGIQQHIKQNIRTKKMESLPLRRLKSLHNNANTHDGKANVDRAKQTADLYSVGISLRKQLYYNKLYSIDGISLKRN